MRLLHITKLKFEEFFDDEIPNYVILSHRWGPDEVSYHDFLAGEKQDGAGYKKILECCEHVAASVEVYENTQTLFRTWKERRAWEEFNADGWLWVEAHRWVWIDTCCIDKTSSAELAEAINSMFHWYEASYVCYVYLSDVTKSEDMDQTMETFRGSQWFTRGWTLQELLAPQKTLFLDKKWTEVGNRDDL